MAASPLSKIERAHQMYREGSYEAALGFYTEAIGMAKTNAQKIALHSNRAACYLKLHDFKRAADECTSVLELDNEHSGALMLRAQTLVTLKEYHSALFDVNRLIEMNPSSEVYQSLQARLRTQLPLAPIPESEEEIEAADEEDEIPKKRGGHKKEEIGEKDVLTPNIQKDLKDEFDKARFNAAFPGSETHSKISSEQGTDQKHVPKNSTSEATATKTPNKESSEKNYKAWQSIPKPKGHSALDYARWDSVEDSSSEDDNDEDDDDDDDEESLPQYRFRVRTVGVRPVK